MNEHIAAAVAKAREALTARPELARVADKHVRVTQVGGLRFRATDQDGHAVESDMPAEVGGTEAALSPGGLLRSALGCCDATVLAMEAAVRGVELTRLEVLVESESDRRGVLGLDVDPAPHKVGVTYRLASPDASEQELRDLVEFAERHSFVLAALRGRVATTVRAELS